VAEAPSSKKINLIGIASIDGWSTKAKLARSEAVRQLIEAGLKSQARTDRQP
jgi:hypothetical protein